MSGSWSVRVNLTGNGASSVVIESIVVYHSANVAPDISNPLSSDTTECNAFYSQDFNATDSDGGQTLTWSKVSDAVSLSIGSSNGTVYGSIALAGVYYVNVTVSDGFATDVDNYTLSVSCANIVITLDATEIGKSSAILHGNLTFAGDVNGSEQVYFQWGSTLNFGFETETKWQGIGPFEVHIIELEPGTTYYFRAYAKAHGGTVSDGHGATLSFMTEGNKDLTVLWLLIFAFVALVLVGLLVPGVHVVAGIAGFFLAFEAYNVTQEVIPSALIAALAFVILIAGVTRKWERR
jgi:hypothetical protein